MSIHFLDKIVVDQIAAGEVVERPSHLVKELIENSLDAGANKIEIHISEGGRNLQITDNGEGIPKDDLQKAVGRHATSKIKKFDDLWQLSTYGFRGEALSSISSVSCFEIISKFKDSSEAYALKYEFGVFHSLVETSHEQGTTVIIKNLFENLPARLKFLKSSAYEQGLIKQVVKAFSLSHPQVEFSVYENAKWIFSYQKTNSFLERAQNLLPVKKLYYHRLEGTNYDNVNLRGGTFLEIVYSSPYDVEKNSKQIWIFIQSRWVQDKIISSAIFEAYRNLLMHGEYPIVVLNLKLPSDLVDVNIHPTKSQVKFINSQEIYKLVYQQLRNSLEKAPWKTTELISSLTTTSDISETVTPTSIKSEIKSEIKSMSVVDDSLELRQGRFSSSEINKNLFQQKLPLRQDRLENHFIIEEKKVTYSYSRHWSLLHVIGQLNLTYIVCQSTDKMVLIDQHAAHERVLFERLSLSRKQRRVDTQSLLIPLVIDLTSEQMEILLEHQDELKNLGIEIEPMGPLSMGVVSSPLNIKESSLGELIKLFVDEKNELGKSFVFEKRVEHYLATLACHSAVRAGQSMSLEQMEKLLFEMDEFPLSSFCPHGRPVNLEFSFLEIEKDFGRRG